MALFHLITASGWRDAQGRATYAPKSLETEGFIHCTGSAAATLEVARAYFGDVAEPVLVLRFDVSTLDVPVRFEAPAAPGGAALPHHAHARLFPHVYGAIPFANITLLGALGRDGDRFSWPSAALETFHAGA